MNLWKFVFTVFVISTFASAVVGMYACGGDSDTPVEPIERQTVEVTRGNLTTMVNAFGRVSLPHQANLGFGSSGNVAEVLVKFGDIVKEGDLLAKLETDSLERAVIAAEGDLRMAQINLEKTISEATLLTAQAAVENAEINLINAQNALEEAQQSSITDAQEAMESAQINLRSVELNSTASIKDAEESLADAKDTQYDFWWNEIYVAYIVQDRNVPEDLTAENERLLWKIEKAAENLDITRQTTAIDVADAEKAVTDAETELQEVQSDSLIIRQKSFAVTQAQASLLKAQEDLAYVEAGYDIEQLEITLSKAQIALDNARDQRAKAAIVAPFDGMVADVGIEAGSSVMANTTAITLVDMSVIEIDASVDEMDVAVLDMGQKAEISVDALPNVKFTGEVTAVSPIAQNVSGLITYDLVVAIDEIAGVNLKDGMTASVDIEAVLAKDAILVPTAAIQRNRATNEATVIVVSDSGQEEMRRVTVGASNKQFTEVIEGLEEGELTVSGGSSATIQSSRISQDTGGSDSVDMADCLARMGDLQECFGKLAAGAAERGISSTQQTGEIDWEEIEAWASDESTSADVRGCLETILENRDCMEQLINRARESGIDMSSGRWGN